MQVNNISWKIRNAHQLCHYTAITLFSVCSVAQTVSPTAPIFLRVYNKIHICAVMSARVALISDLATVIKSLPTPLHICWHSTHLYSLYGSSRLCVSQCRLSGFAWSFQLHISKAPNKSYAVVWDLAHLDRVVIRALVGWVNCLFC